MVFFWDFSISEEEKKRHKHKKMNVSLLHPIFALMTGRVLIFNSLIIIIIKRTGIEESEQPLYSDLFACMRIHYLVVDPSTHAAGTTTASVTFVI